MARTASKTSSALDTITASLVARQSRTDDGSLSVPDQLDKMIAWCAAQTPPIIVGSTYEERDVSGRKPLDKRHGLKLAVDDVEAGRSQMILTAYFDRFVRSVMTRAEVLTRVEGNGGVVMTLDMGLTSNATPVSKFSGVVLAAAAELIADQAGEKTAVTKQRNIDKGVPPFPRVLPCYQRREDGTLEQHPTFAPLVRTAVEMRLSGKSYGVIQKYLHEHDLPIKHTALVRMFASKLLCGEIHFGSFTPNLDAIDDPICTKSEYRKLQSMTATRGRYSKRDDLLARVGVLVCGTCGSKMSVHSSKIGDTLYPYYRCGSRPSCGKSAGIRASVADAFVRDAAIELAASYEGHATIAADVEAAERKLDAAKSKLAKGIRLCIDIDDEDEAKGMLDELQAARDVAAAELEHLVALTAPDRSVSAARDWDVLTLDERRGIIHATIARAVVDPASKLITIEPRAAFAS